MATVNVTEKNFEATVEKGIVLLDFWAAWCGPCRMFAPVFEAASGRHADVTFGKIDTEDQRSLAAAFGIRAIPTLVAMRDGIVLAAQPGAVNARSLDKLIEQVRALDMEEVRRSLEASEAAEAAGA